MQEDIENRTVSMAVSGSKLTGRMLKDAISKLLAHRQNPKAVKDVTPHGKQTVRQLAAQNQGTRKRFDLSKLLFILMLLEQSFSCVSGHHMAILFVDFSACKANITVAPSSIPH